MSDTDLHPVLESGEEHAPVDVDSSPHPAAADHIRARRRPRAVVYLWLWELACGLFLATPIHAWAMRVWGSHPDGDAVLFRPGGHALLTWLGDGDAAIAIGMRTALFAFAVLAVFGQLVFGAAVAALGTGIGQRDRAPSTIFALRTSASAFAPLVVTWLLFGAVQLFVVGLGFVASGSVDRALEPSLGDARSFVARLATIALFVGVAMVVGVFADIARISIVKVAALGAPTPTFAGVRRGIDAVLATARKHFVRAIGAWGWRAALSIALLVVAARIGDAVGDRDGSALWLLFVAHQAIALLRVALRASWLASAIRLTTTT